MSAGGGLGGRGWLPEPPTIGAPQGRREEIDRLDVPAAALGTEGDYILVIGGRHRQSRLGKDPHNSTVGECQPGRGSGSISDGSLRVRRCVYHRPDMAAVYAAAVLDKGRGQRGLDGVARALRAMTRTEHPRRHGHGREGCTRRAGVTNGLGRKPEGPPQIFLVGCIDCATGDYYVRRAQKHGR